ncbi:hypothetical protein [Actinophytocola xanthii]|uniref:Uncharacterized protein n=1 Tax=Actinophytocola xanthii TaxID=1912961 RepID=A0A1Q8CE42_9PSEU|nr:hypothetical protein [Actinophytocola xanthii]OLF12623.1 hypothetical protein BU204_28385 [Actinophytocola xanthii]
MPEFRVHGERRYAVQHHYAVPDSAWHVELSEAVPAPAEWAEIPGSVTHLAGDAFLTAVVPDEDPEREPTVHLHGAGETVVPYEIMRWFMDQVSEEVRRRG